MSINRVVITGMGAVSPYGVGADILYKSMRQGASAVKKCPALEEVNGLNCHIAGSVPNLDEKQIPRKHRRSMSRMSFFSMLSCMEALEMAKITPEMRQNGQTGVIIGTTVGSPQTQQDFFSDYLQDYSIERIKSSLFFKIMGNTCASNVALALGISGRVMAPSAACATGIQAIGLGYEAIALGKQRTMLCGGADELHPLTVAVFDIIKAASTGYNSHPERSPRPFDKDRDGTVCSEGCGIVVLESLESALEREAHIYGEVIGFSATSDTTNISSPDPNSIEQCMRAALISAEIEPDQVEYVNAHATATQLGDPAECEAIERVFGNQTYVSSFKGHLGHSLAGSGALEVISMLKMMAENLCLPTLNLEQPGEDCAMVRHVLQTQPLSIRTVIKNNFALGGINSSLILRKYA